MNAKWLTAQVLFYCSTIIQHRHTDAGEKAQKWTIHRRKYQITNCKSWSDLWLCNVNYWTCRSFLQLLLGVLFFSCTDSVALQVIVYCRLILWCHSYCGIVIPTSLHLKPSRCDADTLAKESLNIKSFISWLNNVINNNKLNVFVIKDEKLMKCYFSLWFQL